jgi:hypothetical protein
MTVLGFVAIGSYSSVPDYPKNIPARSE